MISTRPAATTLSRTADASRIVNVIALMIRPVACSAPTTAWAVWLVMTSCSVPSRSLDCTAHDVRVKARKIIVRWWAPTSVAIRGGTRESGHCSASRMSVSASAIQIILPTDVCTSSGPSLT